MLKEQVNERDDKVRAPRSLSLDGELWPGLVFIYALRLPDPTPSTYRVVIHSPALGGWDALGEGGTRE